MIGLESSRKQVVLFPNNIDINDDDDKLSILSVPNEPNNRRLLGLSIFRLFKKVFSRNE